MATRRFDFISGIESSTAPTASDPVNPSDPTTLGFSDGRYTQGGPPVADIAALKALDVSDRQDKDVILVESQNAMYRYDIDGTGTNDDNFIVQPTAGAGRWFKVSDLDSSGNLNLPFDLSVDGTATFSNEPIQLEEQSVTPATPASGYWGIYPTATGFKQIDDAGGISDLGGSGGSGSGEINVIGSGSSEASGWLASGAGITVATTSTSAELPLEGVIETAIKITPVSGTDYAYYRWTMPESLKQTKLKLAWSQLPLSGYVSGDLKVEVHTNTASDYTGTDNTLPLSTDSSGVSSIPNLTGSFQSSYDSDGSDYYELRIIRVAGTTALSVTNVVSGPGLTQQGSIISSWESYTPTLTGFGTPSSVQFRYRRVGSGLEVQGKFTSGTSTAVEARIAFPPGLTVDSSVLPSLTKVGDGVKNEASTSFNNHITAEPSVSYFTATAQGNATNGLTKLTGSSLLTSGSVFSFYATVPIAEWAGSGTVNLAQNNVEYASVGGTWDSDSSTTVYGMSGSAMGGALTTARLKTITWASAVQPSDRIQVWASKDQVQWFPILGSQLGPSNNKVESTTNASGSELNSGAGVVWRAGASANQTVITFARYINRASDDSPEIDWPSSEAYWVVTKSKAGQAVGFGLVSESGSGLMPANLSNLDDVAATRMGLKSYSHGTTYNGGNAPTLSGPAGLAVVSSSFVPKQMQDGSWLLDFDFNITHNSLSTIDITVELGTTFLTDTAVSGYAGASNSTYQNANGGLNTIRLRAASATTASQWSGRVRLAGKPNWAY